MEWWRSGIVRRTVVPGVAGSIPPLRPCRVALTENQFQRVSWSNSNEIVTRPIRSSVRELDTIVA